MIVLFMYDVVFEVIAFSTFWYAAIKYRNNRVLNIMGSWMFAYYTIKYLL
jgi:hypothetical protein